MEIKNGLIDNSSPTLSMVTTLKACLAKENLKTIYIATGYWDIPGLALLQERLRSFLEKEGTHLKLLLGKDPYVYDSQLKSQKYKNIEYPEGYIKIDLDELEVIDEYKQAIRLLLDFCTENDETSKIQVRVFRKNEQDETQFLHSKCYIFDDETGDFACGIVGSSNFTKKGLEDNAELNYIETNHHQVTAKPDGTKNKSHKSWFNEKWDLSQPWNKIFLKKVLEPTRITKTVKQEKKIEDEQKKQKELSLSPHDLYIKLLQLNFGNIVDKKIGQQIESYLPESYNNLNFQVEAVKRCLSIMHQHGGFLLGDVVGLGKTIIGVLIIKHFLTAPEDDGRERSVLLITPPAIQSSWKRTIEDFDENQPVKIAPKIDFITTGSIGKLVDDEEIDEEDEEVIDDDKNDTDNFSSDLQFKNYGLIIIDESHKFRNSGTQMYKALDELIGNIYANTCAVPYVGLLSATLQNNSPEDLKNQIYLFERNRQASTLKKAESGNIERFFSNACKKYDDFIKGAAEANDEQKAKHKEALEQLSLEIRDCVLNDILERRTRTDIKEYYKHDIEKQNIIFPEIEGPKPLVYKMGKDLANLFTDTMNIIAPPDEEKNDNYIKYFRYRATQYLKDHKNQKKYEGGGNRSTEIVSNQLARLMQILLVKRLESSFNAFKKSLVNLRDNTLNMIKMWENNTIFICPQIDVNKELNTIKKSKSFEECLDDIRNDIKRLNSQGRNKKNQNCEYKRDDFNPEYINFLKSDLACIQSLCDSWAVTPQDPKFDEFKDNLREELFDTEKNVAQKLVIFSEAKDTVDSLKQYLENKDYKPLVITAANRKEKENVIRENFDANYNGEWKNDYDVIITTDVLAEGVNLHRANVILNYDTPWNSTRLMQRIGRVNRIGSKAKKVYVYNFMPSSQGDSVIFLFRKAFTKLQSFHTLFGEDSKIFSEDENVSHYAICKAVDGPESPMEKYISELKKFKDENPERYALIEQTNNGWQIASQTNSNAYFLIDAPRAASLCIKKTDINSSADPEIITLTEMLDSLKVDPATPATPLPDNWNTLSEEAITAYNQHFVYLDKSRNESMNSKAKDAIAQLYEKNTISDESKSLLKTALYMARNGNVDIIRKMIKLGEQINSNLLFNIQQSDIDALLKQEIGKMVAKVETKQGKPEILLATCK